MTTIVVVLSIFLQLTAAAWAIRLIRFTGKRTAWYLISAALLLMAIRRMVSLYVLLGNGGGFALEVNEFIGLLISILMFAGVLFIEGYFRHSEQANRDVRESEYLFRLLFEKAGEGNLLPGNGVGFDPALADRLFAVFQRLHREEDFEGTGAGLAIAQRIIRRHNGWIWTESRVGQGATFHFHLHSQAGDGGGVA